MEIGWNVTPEGKRVFCDQSPFPELAGFSASVPGVCPLSDVGKIRVQGIQKLLNSLIHVEFNMDIPDPAAQESPSEVEMSMMRAFGRILK